MNHNDRHESEGKVEQTANIGCIVVPAVLFMVFVIWRIRDVGLIGTLKGISDFIVSIFDLLGEILGHPDFWKGPVGWAVGGFLFLVASGAVIAVVKGVSDSAFPRLVDSYTKTYLARGYKMEDAARKAGISARVYFLLTYCVLIIVAAIWVLILLEVLL